MNSRGLWIWLSLAVVLGVLVALHERFGKPPPPIVRKVLPGLEAAKVDVVQIRPRGQLEIRAERATNGWRLVEPIAYPAQAVVLDTLLDELQRLEPAAFIPETEPGLGESEGDDFGLKTPVASIVLHQGNHRTQVLIGARTAPGDQFFLQVVGVEGVNVVDAEILGLLPSTANDLRDTGFVSLEELAFDRLAVTNGGRFFEVARTGSKGRWRMVRPIDARANNERIFDLVQKLGAVRVKQFVSDEPSPDLEPFGLRQAGLELAFKQGTNFVMHLKFGSGVTNNTNEVYACRVGHPAIVAVTREPLAGWRGSVNDFRDPHLVSLDSDMRTVEIRGAETFSVTLQTNGAWRVSPQGWPADPVAVRDLLVNLGTMRIIEFAKDVVTPLDLPGYGLAQPSRKYILSGALADPKQTNAATVEVDFGTNVNDRVYVRRSDESSVFAVSRADVQRLPMAPIEMRERRIWEISEEDLAGVTIQQNGKTRQMLRQGAHQWRLAPGSQGVINDLAIEESVKPLCRLNASAWVGRGADQRQAHGFAEQGYRLTLDLKTGEKLTLELGGQAGGDSAYGAVTLQGEVWIFVMPPTTYRFLSTYLVIPGAVL